MSSRVIVLRGDLYSDTGYGRATRALSRLLQRQTHWLFATSLHEHDRRQDNKVSLPLVSDSALMRNPLFRGAIVINLCLPNDFVRVQGAINVGYFFWETAALPAAAFWRARLLTMDALWAPSHWQSAWLSSVTGRPHIPVIPWPQKPSETQPHPTEALLEVPIHAPLSRDAAGDLSIRPFSATGARGDPSLDTTGVRRLRDLYEHEADLFLAVQTDAPRKGLALLLASWMAFKKTPEGRYARLLIKLSSIDVGLTTSELHAETSRFILQAQDRFGAAELNIWLMYEHLTALEMRTLFSRADAFVSATMGEGFGGPIAEALLESTPVIVPRHTAIEDILEATYPLAVASAEHRLKLRANLDLYAPSSPWYVVDDISFVEKLRAFVRMSQNERAAIGRRAKAHLLGVAGVPIVEEAIARQLQAYNSDGVAA